MLVSDSSASSGPQLPQRAWMVGANSHNSGVQAEGPPEKSPCAERMTEEEARLAICTFFASVYDEVFAQAIRTERQAGYNSEGHCPPTGVAPSPSAEVRGSEPMVPLPPVPLPPIPGYRIEELIGRGGMGIVY